MPNKKFTGGINNLPQFMPPINFASLVYPSHSSEVDKKLSYKSYTSSDYKLQKKTAQIDSTSRDVLVHCDKCKSRIHIAWNCCPDCGNAFSKESELGKDWRGYFSECVKNTALNADETRTEAENIAFECRITLWLNSNSPQHEDDTVCPHCQKPNGASGTSCIPTLKGNGGHLWLHYDCLTQWLVRRRQEAIQALNKMEVRPCLGSE